MTGACTMSAASPAARRAPCLPATAFRVLEASYWNTLLFPLMLLHRLTERDDAESDVRDFRAGSMRCSRRRSPSSGRRSAPAYRPAVRRLPADRGGARWLKPAARRSPSSCRSTTAPATIGELVERPARPRDRGRAGDRAGGRRQPGQQPRRLQEARRRAGRAGHGAEPQPQFRRAQRGDGGPGPRARRLRHHHGRRPAEPAGRGEAPVRACARRQLRRGLHLLRGEAARRLAQPRQPLHQLVRRPADRQAARASISRASAASRPSCASTSRRATRVRIPMSTGWSSR